MRITNVALLTLGLAVSAAAMAPSGAACDRDSVTCFADPATDCLHEHSQSGQDENHCGDWEHVAETGPSFLVWAATHPGEATENLCEVDGVCI